MPTKTEVLKTQDAVAAHCAREPESAAVARRNGARQWPLRAVWARHADEVREAQRLRYDVFAREMGARLETPQAGFDIDRFDDFCEHLLVRDALTQQVVGTYRLLTPAQAVRAGGTYCDTEFDLSAIDRLRPRMVELGRSCVHPAYRKGAALLTLWSALAVFMQRNGLDVMVGCASMPLQHAGSDATQEGLQAAGSVWQTLRQTHSTAPGVSVRPWVPLPLVAEPAVPAEPPPLIRGYLRLGTRLLGPPAWDPAFNTADLPMMLRTEDLPARYRQSS